mmetsp:Transcript_13983/g.33908  ORF Transcript_13983/g.33908 Transcript_13983/m.33908 type:complete len:244 (+) Transcript_13983:314-1045(+)
MQRRPPILVIGVNVGVRLKKCLDRVDLPLARRTMQRRLSLRILGVNVRFGLEEGFDRLLLPRPRRPMQRRLSDMARGVNVGVGLEQRPDCSFHAGARRAMQRRLPDVVLGVHVRVFLQEGFDRCLITLFRGSMQRRRSILEVLLLLFLFLNLGRPQFKHMEGHPPSRLERLDFQEQRRALLLRIPATLRNVHTRLDEVLIARCGELLACQPFLEEPCSILAEIELLQERAYFQARDRLERRQI